MPDIRNEILWSGNRLALRCPVCGGELSYENNCLKCPRRHSYDIAKRGYVNLLPPSGHGGHGDDKLMVNARTAFLDKGYYLPLEKAVAEKVAEGSAPNDVIIDAGCGEGRYTRAILDAVGARGKIADIIGIDISKDALNKAAGRSREYRLVAASTAAMPLTDACAGTVVNIFSPLMTEEFHRVLKSGGRLIRVVPLERHLWELKALIYDTPYENPPENPALPGFDILSVEDLNYTFTLESGDDIINLFMMTPYYYKTGRKDQEKLFFADRLTVSACFRITEYVRA